MPKVFGIHELATKPGVNGAEFERFVTEEAFPAMRWPGTTFYLLKGDRGERNGQYLLVMEFESVEARNRLFPAPDTTGAEVQQAIDSARGVFEKWASFGALPGSEGAIYTDYVEAAKH
jgi:hypothetical protein